MSGVYKRNRTETKIQFYVNALDLQEEITKYVMREKVLPKKWRYAIGYDLINKADSLVDYITFANSIYPAMANFKEKLLRRIFQTLAIATCYRIQNKLRLMERCIDTVKIEHMEKMIDLIGHEIDLLKGWKKSEKVF